MSYLTPGVCHDSDQQVEEDDSNHKHVKHHQADGGLRVVAVVEDAKLETTDHEVEHCQPGMPDGAELLQQVLLCEISRSCFTRSNKTSNGYCPKADNRRIPSLVSLPFPDKNRHMSSRYVQYSSGWDVTVIEGGQLTADQVYQMILKLCSTGLVLDCFRSCQDCITE